MNMRNSYAKILVAVHIQLTMSGGGGGGVGGGGGGGVRGDGGGGGGGGGDPDAIEDLSNLTDAERSLVLEVLRRDEELRQQESTRIEVLKSEIEALKRILAVNQSHGRDRGRKCSLCSASFGWIFGRGDTCLRCQETKVCDRCRHATSTTERWVCLLCYKKQQLYLTSGSWFHRTYSGQRHLRPLTESRTSTLTFHKDVERTSSLGVDDYGLSTTKSFSPATLPRAKKQEVRRTPNILTVGGGECIGHQLIPGQIDKCVYPDESDRELLMLLTENLKMGDRTSSTDVGHTTRHQSQESAQSAARRIAQEEVLRREQCVAHAQQCLSDDYQDWLRCNENWGLRSYRTLEDLSSSFKDAGSVSTNAACNGEEGRESKPVGLTPDDSFSNASKIPKQKPTCLQNETGECIKTTSDTRQEARDLLRNDPVSETAVEAHVSNEFQCRELTDAERKPPVTRRQPPATDDSGSNGSSLWSGEASLQEISSMIPWQELSCQTTDRSRSGAEDSLTSSLSENLNSRTLDFDLDLLAWKAEIEQLFHEPSLTDDLEWEEEMNSLGVVRDMVVWSGSTDGRRSAGIDPLLGSSVLFLPLSEDESGFVTGDAQQVAVEVAEEKRMRLTSQQPRCYLPVFPDEDSLSIISEHTEPTGSDQEESADTESPASAASLEAGWQDDTLTASDEESPEITLTDAGIDRAIDSIVKDEVQRCPSPCDLDAEIDRLVASNREPLSRTFEKSTTSNHEMNQLDVTFIQENEYPGSSFNPEMEHDNNDTIALSNCESFGRTYFGRSPASNPSEITGQIITSTSEMNPDVAVLSRCGDLNDTTTSDPVSNSCLTVNNHKRLINLPQEFQPSFDNPFCSSYNITAAEYQNLGSPEPGTSSTEDANDSERMRSKTKARSCNGELLIESIDAAFANTNKLSGEEETKELGKEISDSYSSCTRYVSHSPGASKNVDAEENHKDSNGVSF